MPEVFLAKVIWTVLGSPGLFLKAHVPRFRSEKWIGNTHRTSWCKCKKTMFRQTRAQIFWGLCVWLISLVEFSWGMRSMLGQCYDLPPKYKCLQSRAQWVSSSGTKSNTNLAALAGGSTDISWQESTSNASCKMYVTGKKGFPQVCQNFGPAFCREVHCLVPVLKQVWHSCILSLPLSHIAKTYGKSTTGSSFSIQFFQMHHL